MLLCCDVGPVPLQVGAVIMLDAGPEFDVGAAREALAERITAVPRLRQRLVRPPAGCGRPFWIDHAGFDIGEHVRSVGCGEPGDQAALLKTAATILTAPLPWSRPLWSASFVTGLAGSRVAVVVVFHHVLADGIGGLAVLASLVDGAAKPVPLPFPRPAPSRRQLAGDALRSRLRAFSRPGPRLPKLGSAGAELNLAGVLRPAGTVLNGPTGQRRSIAVTRAELDQIRAAAHAGGATVNDITLLAIARALHCLVARRGHAPDDVVASVMVGGRATAGPDDLGNLVGVMPVRLPAGGDRIGQLRQIAASTSRHKVASRGASAALLRPAFRTLASTGALRWFINHQRFVNVFVTSLRGPRDRLALLGAPVTDVLPLTLVAGNVALSFAAISYAGSLVVVITADPERCPDVDVLAALLQSELDAAAGLVGAAADKAAGLQG